VRRGNRPIGYILKEAEPGSLVTFEILQECVVERFRLKIVEEALNEELSRRECQPQMPTVSVAICTHDRPRRLARCLCSLATIRARHGLEILVVDNAPRNGATGLTAAQFPGVRYVVEKRAGLDFARNRAWMEADGDWIAYLDDDVVVDKWWFEGLQEAWKENQDAWAFTGLVMPLELSSRAQVLFERRDGFRRGFDKRRYAASLPENPLYPCGAGIFGAGCNMALRRDVLRELGGFDDALDTGASLPGGGDLDMFYRVIRAGGVLVYEPRIMVFHEHRHSEIDLQRQYFSWGLGFMAFVGKHLRGSGEHKDRFRSLACWWARDQLRQLKASLRGRHPLPPRMIVAEISGGLIGIFGEYRRSCKRIARLDRQVS
jgi:GT2 family glycosyltransferase